MGITIGVGIETLRVQEVFIDYRRENAITIRDTYRLLCIDDYVYLLAEAIIFTTVDSSSGYWLVPIHEAEKEETMFTCQFGTYRFKRVQFGLMTAATTFQRIQDILLGEF